MKIRWVVFLLLVIQIEVARAVEFEPLNKALLAVLGTPKVQKKTYGPSQVFYSKNAAGKPDKLAVVEKGMYEPNCTHTWVIGLDSKSTKVTQIRVVEMSCQHAFPTKAGSFLTQYKGVGPAETKDLKKKIKTIAKATGSSDLTTDAVVRAITTVKSHWGEL